MKHTGKLGGGAALAAVVFGRRFDADIVTAGLALLAIVFYGWGLWDWTGQITNEREWGRGPTNASPSSPHK
jgi:hypothetical protein